MSGSGTLAMNGTGTVALAGSNSYTGGTLVSSGALSGSTASLQGTITNNGLVIFNQIGSGTYSGVMSGSGTLAMNGTGTVALSGSNSYSGGTLVSSGALSGTTASLQGAITNNALVIFNQIGSGTYSGVMSGSGTLVMSGTGMVTLTSSNSVAGATVIKSGTLAATTLGTGALSVGGTALNPASFNFTDTLGMGTLTVGAVNMSGYGTIALANPYNQVLSTGAVTIAGGTNFISLAGTWTNFGTYALIQGTGLRLGGGVIDLTGDANTFGGSAVGLNGSFTNTNAGLVYTFTNNATSLEMIIAQLATNYYWTGGKSGNWNTTSTNWVVSGTPGNVAFTVSNNALFTNATTMTVTNAGILANDITVNNNTGLVSFGGGTITAASLTMSGNGALTVNNALNTMGAFTAGSGTTSLLFSNNTIGGGVFLSGGATLNAGYNRSLGLGSIDMEGATLVPGAKVTNLANAIIIGMGVNTINDAGPVTLSGQLIGSNSATLVKTNVGVLTLTGNNTNFSGSFIVNAGTLAGSASSLTGNISLNNKKTTLTINQYGSGEYTNNITGSNGAVTITVTTPPSSPSSTLLLSGNNSYNGGTTIKGGAVAGYAGSSLRGTIVNNGRVSFLNTNSTSYIGGMSGTGTLIMAGTGTVSLSGTNTYKGGTLITNNGTLVGNILSLQGNISDNGTVAFNQPTVSTYKGVVNGSGTLAMVGIGNLTLSGINTYTGGTFVNSGTLSGGVVNLPGAITLANGGTIAFNQTAGGLETNAITGTGNLIKLGASSLTLSATNNSYSGLTTISAGTLVFTNGASLSGMASSGIVNNGTLLFSTPFSSPGTYSGTLSGSTKGLLTKQGNGTITLAGNNSAYLGTVNIIAGGISASSLGGGALKLAGTTTSPVFTDTKTNATLNTGAITLGGNSTLALANGNTTIRSTGIITITGINFISMAGTWMDGSYPLLTGTKVTGKGVASLKFTGTTLGSGTASLNSSYTNAGFVYTFTSNATSISLVVSDAPVSPAVLVRGAAKVLPASSTLTIAPAKAKVASAKAKVVTNASNTVTSNTVVIPATNATASNTVVVAPAGLVHVVPAIALPSPTPAPLPVLNYIAFAQNPNQKQVASALNSFQSAPSPDQQVVVATLDVMAAEGSVSQAYNAIMPSYYQSLGTIAFNLANAQNSELVQRLWGLRVAEGTGFSMNGMPDNTPVVEGQGDGKSVADPSKDILRPGADSHWGMFVDGNGVFAQANSGNMLPGYNSQSGGVTTGLTYKWNDSFGTGLYAGYEGTYANYGGGSRLIDNSVRFGVFGTYGQKNSKGEALGFYANGLAGGGYNNYQTTRAITFGGINRTANASPGAGELDTMLAGGYDMKKGNFTFGPTASLQYTYLGVNGVNETGAQSLNFNSSGWNTASMLSSVGAHAAYNWQVKPDILVVPQISLNWQHEFMQNPYSVNGNLGGTSPSFNNTSATGIRDYLYTGIGFTVEFAKRWNTSFFYNAAAGNNNLTSQNIFWSLGLKF
jgi:autotransporter-associated beta strand protein